MNVVLQPGQKLVDDEPRPPLTPEQKVWALDAVLDRCIARAQDLHLCAVVDRIREAQATLKAEAAERLNVTTRESPR